MRLASHPPHKNGCDLCAEKQPARSVVAGNGAEGCGGQSAEVRRCRSQAVTGTAPANPMTQGAAAEAVTVEAAMPDGSSAAASTPWMSGESSSPNRLTGQTITA